MKKITISNNTGSLFMNEEAEISTSIKLLGKVKKRTLKNRLFNKWRASYLTFSISFIDLPKSKFDVLKDLFATPDVYSKTLNIVDENYFVVFSDDSLTYSERYSYEKDMYLYNVSINLEEAMGIKEL